MKVLSEKKSNFSGDIVNSLFTLKRVLIALCIVALVLYSIESIVFGIKFALIALTAYFSARGTEMLFITHQRPLNYIQAREEMKESMPEISGLLFALMLPVSTPLYVVALGIVFAVFVVRMAFGGFSFNIFNAAIAARVFVEVSWSDAINSADPIGLIDYLLSLVINVDYSSASNLLMGTELLSLIFSATIFISLLYLAFKKLVNPFTTIFVLIVIAILFWYFDNLLLVFSPIMLLAVVFGLNDPITTSSSLLGKLISLTIFISVCLYMVIAKQNMHGMLFAILFMNMMIPIVDDRSENTTKFKAILVSILIISASLYLTNITLDVEGEVAVNE